MDSFGSRAGSRSSLLRLDTARLWPAVPAPRARGVCAWRQAPAPPRPTAARSAPGGNRENDLRESSTSAQPRTTAPFFFSAAARRAARAGHTLTLAGLFEVSPPCRAVPGRAAALPMGPGQVLVSLAGRRQARPLRGDNPCDNHRKALIYHCWTLAARPAAPPRPRRDGVASRGQPLSSFQEYRASRISAQHCVALRSTA